MNKEIVKQLLEQLQQVDQDPEDIGKVNKKSSNHDKCNFLGLLNDSSAK